MPKGIYIRRHPTPNFFGHKHTEETKKKMSIIHTGQIPWNKGVPTKEETKQKISNTLKGTKKSEEWIKKLILRQIGSKRGPLSKEHKDKLSLLLKGEKSPRWKGGTYGTERHRIMGSKEYKDWRNFCFKRDNYMCQKYGIKNERLVVHHINNYFDFPELRFDVDNGITLSRRAHIEFHKKYGERENNAEQLFEFINN